MKAATTTATTTRYKVLFEGGESRTRPGAAVDYMLAVVDGVELYAETTATEDGGSYDELRAEIVEQAAAVGVSADQLSFYYD